MQEKVTEVFAEEFSAYLSALKIPKDASCLIVGLGNWNVTPDALYSRDRKPSCDKASVQASAGKRTGRVQVGQRACSRCDGINGN